MTRTLAIALAASLLVSPVHAAPRAPQVPIASIEQLPQPLPKPYDETADALAAVNKARAQAKAQGKRLLIDLGGNWCADCRILAAVMEQPPLQAFLKRHFVIVTVDVGRFDKNGAVAAHYGITGRLVGVPAILAVDPRRDVLLNRDRLFALSDARSMTPQALADWLAQWAA